MAIYHEDIVDIELESGNIHRSFAKHSIGSGDAAANRFGVRVLRAGVAVALAGVVCQGYFHNANGENIALTSHGTVSGNVAYVTLPQACYNVEGNFTLSLKLVGGGVTGTMRIVDGVVDNTGTTGAVAPTGSVPTYEEVLALYEDVLDLADTAWINRGSTTAETCDSLTAEGVYFCSKTGTEKSIEDFPFDNAGWLISTSEGEQALQYAVEWAARPKILIRERRHNVWGDWSDVTGAALNVPRSNIYQPTDPVSADDLTESGVYFSSSTEGVPGIEDMPFYNGWLWVSALVDNNNPIYLQIAYPYATTFNPYYRRMGIDGVWSSWKELGSGSGHTTIENTYNITCSPQITTDTNGWLQAVDTDTSSESGKTDMTGAIMTMLSSTGYCHLGPGIFYVSGNIDMPEGSMLEGCGRQTVVRLLQSVTDGYIVRMHTRSTVKNICFSGGYGDLDVSSGSNAEKRRGINFIGNRDGEDTGVTPTTTRTCMVEGCWFKNLGSGIYGYNSNGGINEGMIINDCYFETCKAGINFDYWTEYHKVSNCVTFKCYYGCINNGGNNVFTNCSFHGTIGFLMDNSDADKTNNSHGSCIGCVFNHIDNWNHPADGGGGDALKIISNANGFLFDGCQFWYSAVKIQNSRGMTFSCCMFGGGAPVIKVEGSYGAFFNGCTFQNAPSLDVNAATKFNACYLSSDGSVIGQ